MPDTLGYRSPRCAASFPPTTEWRLAAIETPGTGGRRHEYLTLEQERADLSPFFTRAEAGEIATAEQIQQAFEAEVQHPVHLTTIYRLLDRQSFRKLVPRPRHPKANARCASRF